MPMAIPFKILNDWLVDKFGIIFPLVPAQVSISFIENGYQFFWNSAGRNRNYMNVRYFEDTQIHCPVSPEDIFENLCEGSFLESDEDSTIFNLILDNDDGRLTRIKIVGTRITVDDGHGNKWLLPVDI